MIAALVSAFVVAAAALWAASRLSGDMQSVRIEQRRARLLEIVRLLGSAAGDVQADPRAAIRWHATASLVRRLFPEEMRTLDEASGSTFPFGAEAIEAAHAQWTSDWLAWERNHDADYKLKAAAIEDEMRAADPKVVRSRLDVIESEKLNLYQRHYEEYVRVAKSLQTLAAASADKKRRTGA